MSLEDRQPLSHHPAYAPISRAANNRLGAVFSALHTFWSARAAAFNQAAGTGANRRDAYSVVLFDHTCMEVVQNDFNRNPDQLLSKILQYTAGGGTDFNRALSAAKQVMQRYWSTERQACNSAFFSLSDAFLEPLLSSSCLMGNVLFKMTQFIASAGKLLVLGKRFCQVFVLFRLCLNAFVQ